MRTEFKYFKGIKTLEQLRSTWKDLLKKNHPDGGGDTKIAQEINAEYDDMFALLKSGVVFETEAEKKKWDETEDETIRNILNKIIFFQDVNIEIVGCWIWCDGNTFNYRDELKNLGFKWSSSRKKWHWAPYQGKHYKGKKLDFDTIRAKYGSVEVENEERRAIA